MRSSRRREEHIIAVLSRPKRYGRGGTLFAGRNNEQTFYRWKAKFGGLDSSDGKKLKQLEEENRKLKHVVVGLTLERRALKGCVVKKLQRASN